MSWVARVHTYLLTAKEPRSLRQILADTGCNENTAQSALWYLRKDGLVCKTTNYAKNCKWLASGEPVGERRGSKPGSRKNLRRGCTSKRRILRPSQIANLKGVKFVVVQDRAVIVPKPVHPLDIAWSGFRRQSPCVED